MGTVVMILAMIVGMAALVLFVVIIIAVLKVSGEYDDTMEYLIQQRTLEGLKNRDKEKTSREDTDTGR